MDEKETMGITDITSVNKWRCADNNSLKGVAVIIIFPVFFAPISGLEVRREYSLYFCFI